MAKPRMASIAASIARIKRDVLGALDRGVVEQVCAELGHAWRDRELDPATTVALFVQQILHGNVACSEVRHLAAGASAGASAGAGGKRFTPRRLLPGARSVAAGGGAEPDDARVRRGAGRDADSA